MQAQTVSSHSAPLSETVSSVWKSIQSMDSETDSPRVLLAEELDEVTCAALTLSTAVMEFLATSINFLTASTGKIPFYIQ